MSILGRLLCALPRKLGGGHRRGKLHRQGFVDAAGPKVAFYRCPRCGRETRYKVKAQSVQP